ncbi:MAG: chemotaxis-specific protein-glutamate methyltransferase CheB [Acidobacteriota bacterium]
MNAADPLPSPKEPPLKEPPLKEPKIRVLIVEDSLVIREFLEYIIGQDPRLEVVGSVGSAEEALRLLNPDSWNAIRPDVISMDIRLPGMDGFEATQRIMSETPTPIVVVSASVESEDLCITMNALQAGALAVLEKPVGTTSMEYEAVASKLCTQLAIMSKVKVVRRHVSASTTPRSERRGQDWMGGSHPAPFVYSDRSSYSMLGIVSSTGGPNALVRLLGQLGPNFPLPIAVVQHITPSFLEGFASWLDSACPFSVVVVRDREPLESGKIYVACQDHHLRLKQGFVQVDAGGPVCGQRPSGDVLFESMANILGNQGLGVLLTGMGEDGAAGLLQLRQAGGYTIAEDESTAVVYGMPAEAVRLGAVRESLPLPSIAPRILQMTVAQKEVA